VAFKDSRTRRSGCRTAKPTGKAKSIRTASIAARRKADGADGAKKLLIDEAAAVTALEFVGHDNHVEWRT